MKRTHGRDTGATQAEETRLADLRRYQILDTPTEELFADFVEIAAEICAAPVALVSFVDEKRQWFAAEIGLGMRETPIQQSVCAHAIRHPGLFVVPDLAADPRFRDSELVTAGPKLRFYAGVPLESMTGQKLGTICVLDHSPRPEGLTGRQQRTLEALARQIMAQLELRLAVAERNAALAEKALLLQEVHHRVKNSLATVQSLLLLQARSLDPVAASPLRQGADRIRAFGAVHEHLYQVGTSDVDLASYLRKLLADVRASQAGVPGARDIVFNADSITWPTADAPTFGLILVELLTNSLKYGAGAITVSLQQAGAGVILTVEDEGTELPTDFSPADSKGLGMRIVTGLLGQHDLGCLHIDRTRGHTCFRVEFNPPSSPAEQPG